MKYAIGTGALLSAPQLLRAGNYPATDVTFLVINDIHACRLGDGLSPNCAEEGKTDANLLRHIAALNHIEEHKWPSTINGQSSGLSSAGTRIAKPKGIIVCGDVTDDGGGQTAEPGEGAQLLQFSHRYQEGTGPDRVHFPVYVGLGNHDLDQDGRAPQVNWYRDELRDYIRMNHKPSAFFKPPVPVDNYDELSDNYSWNWQGLHLIQAQRYAGDTNKGAASGLDWLKQDLATYASDGRPIVIFQHYGWDKFSLERWDPVKGTFDDGGTGAPHWWDDAQRQAFWAIIQPYNVVGIFHGHEHDTPMAYKAGVIDVFKAKAAFKGGFTLVRIKGKKMDVALGEATDDDGGITFTTAFSKSLK